MKRPTRARAARRPGMSLLEVIVALAIFIMALAALGQLVQLGMDEAVEADRQTVATRLAQSKMAEVEAGAVSTANGGAGEFTDQETLADGTALWKWEAVSTEMDIPNLYSVTVTVSLTTSGNGYSLSMTQLVYDPAFQGNAAPATDPTATATQGNNP